MDEARRAHAQPQADAVKTMAASLGKLSGVGSVPSFNYGFYDEKLDYYMDNFTAAVNKLEGTATNQLKL